MMKNHYIKIRCMKIISIIILMITGFIGSAIVNAGEFDGPYIFSEDGSREQANWICNSQLATTSIPQAKASQTQIKINRPADCGQLPEPTLTNSPYIVAADSFTDVKKVIALSDTHGQYDILFTLLKNQRIIDGEGNWIQGDAHLVMTGDMFDRGHQVNEVLWLLYQLDQQASAAGGRLHLLMGNHEQMVLRGDLRYIHPRYELASELLKRPYDKLYDSSSELGQWLRSKHTLVKINDTLFLHGGISQEWVDRGLTISKANQLYRQNLEKSKTEIKQDELLNFLFFSSGPTWYRGYFSDSFTETELDSILAFLKVNRIVVGHTSQERVLGLFNNKVLAVDSSIKRGKSGELLIIEQQQGTTKLTRGLYDGSRVPLISD